MILGGLYFCIEKSTESIDKDKWQNLLVSIEGFALAIVLGVYTAIRMDKTEKYRIEDKLTESYAEALRNLYTTEKEELQLLGIRELYNVYQELAHRVSIDFRNQLEEKILNSIFEYLREVGVRVTERKKAVNKIFDLFLTSKIKFPKDYRANLKGAELQGADLRGAQLQNADLQRAQLQGADLQCTKLEGADLQKAVLQGANLQYAELEGAYLQEANLQGANLRYVGLEGARLDRTQLQKANLQYANLQSEDLIDADPDLTEAIVYEFRSIHGEPSIEKIKHLKHIYERCTWRIEKIKKEKEIPIYIMENGEEKKRETYRYVLVRDYSCVQRSWKLSIRE